jgi:hypothetical protein
MSHQQWTTAAAEICACDDCQCQEIDMLPDAAPTAEDSERLVLERLLAQRSRARRQDSAAPAGVAASKSRTAMEWRHRGTNGSDDEEEDDNDDEEDEDGFVLPPGWRSVRQTGANGEVSNAYTFTDGTRTVNTITSAWELHRASGGGGTRGGASSSGSSASARPRQPRQEGGEEHASNAEDDVLTGGVSVSDLLDSLLLSDAELLASASAGSAPHPPLPAQALPAQARGAMPDEAAPPLEQIALEDLESEVQALLHDEELQGQLLEMLGDLLEDGVSGLGEAEEEEEIDVDLLDVAELSLPPQPTDGAAAGADRGGFPTGGKDVGDLRDLDE